jgi:uncharacterized SAM-binding protein YcdF (DUF218 family)
MVKVLKFFLAIGASLCMLALLCGWLAFYKRGKRFALRDRLRQADAIVVLAGTRGNIRFLDGKICTAVSLYQQGWAPRIICAGKFSVKVTDTPTLIPLKELEAAAVAGRIQAKDVTNAARQWDIGLGARYMAEQAMQKGVPSEAIWIEDESLHTRENAEHVLFLLQKHDMHRIILVTSPFHQLRTSLTFAKIFQPYGVEIINYYADTGEWHPATWFLSTENRKLVQSEIERIQIYRAKGDLL